MGVGRRHRFPEAGPHFLCPLLHWTFSDFSRDICYNYSVPTLSPGREHWSCDGLAHKAPQLEVMFFKFICAVVTRSIFILISLIGVWRVVWVKDNGLYWLLTVLYLPLVVEMILTLRRRGGKDYKWYEWRHPQQCKWLAIKILTVSGLQVFSSDILLPHQYYPVNMDLGASPPREPIYWLGGITHTCSSAV